MNRQEFFDRGVVGIIRQGRPSMRGSMTCLYRGPDNSKCAVGHNIPDEKYHPDMEGAAPVVDNEEAPIAARVATACGCETADDAAFARLFQRVHDGVALEQSPDFIRRFAARARTFATHNALNTEALDAALSNVH